MSYKIVSSLERVVFPAAEVSVPSMMSLNGQLFICYKDQIDTLVSNSLVCSSFTVLTSVPNQN